MFSGGGIGDTLTASYLMMGWMSSFFISMITLGAWTFSEDLTTLALDADFEEGTGAETFGADAAAEAFLGVETGFGVSLAFATVFWPTIYFGALEGFETGFDWTYFGALAGLEETFSAAYTGVSFFYDFSLDLDFDGTLISFLIISATILFLFSLSFVYSFT